ncbi:MAG: hypothetical protein AB1630_08725, partial [bacterium]
MKFYELGYDDDNYEDAEEVSDRTEIVGWCPIYGRWHPGILKKKEGEEAILTIDLSSPDIGDFIRIWGRRNLIVIDKVAQLFKEARFTGYELKPVRINKIKRMRKPKPIPKLWELVITGFAGMASSESGVKLTYKCEYCNRIKYSGCTNKSALIDSSQWNGSDFFFIYPMTNFIFITERVKEFIEENKLTACKTILIEEIKGIEDYLLGGKLYYNMPIERARAFGEPLGIYVDPKELWQRAIQLDNDQNWPSKEQWREFIKKAEIKERPKILAEFQNVLKKYGSPSSSIKL